MMVGRERERREEAEMGELRHDCWGERTPLCSAVFVALLLVLFEQQKFTENNRDYCISR